MPKPADCPECEYCCLIGLCCPPAQQRTALTTLFTNATGESAEACQPYVEAILAARLKALQAE